ncbi:substrate-binding periplasmic protein [Deefgea rivuli]|uniref:substrate-binding periplasmic protein n=1 Tax=Deefgea rivuli TaxID=400948 RepID=UPI00048594E4|nr:transporter substrate-binding domain-containing protein [Deefgea rivuli]
MRGLLFVLLVASLNVAFAKENILIMGYIEREKEPFIAESPSNQGFFNDLFSRAAQKIGFKLQIVRFPKKRLYEEIHKGKVDFTPGSFSLERADSLNWFPYGLVSKEVCLSRIDLATITDLNQTPPLRVITELGSSKASIHSRYPALTAEVLGGGVDANKAIKALKGRRGDLFIIEQEPLQFYLHKNRIASLDVLGLKLHPNCLPQANPLLVGFSRSSEHYAEIPNPNYNSKLAPSASNLPMLVSPDSLAGQFAKALMELKTSNETQRLLQRYMDGSQKL